MKDVMELADQVFDHVDEPEKLADDCVSINYMIIVDMISIYVLLFFFFLWRYRRQHAQDAVVVMASPRRGAIAFLKQLCRLVVHLIASMILFVATTYLIFRVSEWTTRGAWNTLYREKVDERLVAPLEAMGFSRPSVLRFLRQYKIDSLESLKKNVFDVLVRITKTGGSLRPSAVINQLTSILTRSTSTITRLFSDNQANLATITGRAWYSTLWEATLPFTPPLLRGPLDAVNLMINPMAGIQAAQAVIRREEVIRSFHLFFNAYIQEIMAYYARVLRASMASAGVAVIVVQRRPVQDAIRNIAGLLRAPLPQPPAALQN